MMMMIYHLGKIEKQKIRRRRINGIEVERSGTGTTSNRLCDKGRFIHSSNQLGPTRLQTIKSEQDGVSDEKVEQKIETNGCKHVKTLVAHRFIIYDMHIKTLCILTNEIMRQMNEIAVSTLV